jgi:hypothetical protein
VYHVDTEYCNFRSAELWTFPSGLTSPKSGGQIQNQYGTKLLRHDACLVDTKSGTNPRIIKCNSKQPPDQLGKYALG